MNSKIEDVLDVLNKKYDFLNKGIYNITKKQNELDKRLEELELILKGDTKKNNEEDNILKMYFDLKETIVGVGINLENLILDRTKSKGVKEFYRMIDMAVESKELPFFIKGLAKFAYQEENNIIIPCKDMKLYKIIKDKFIDKINKYSEYQVKFILEI